MLATNMRQYSFSPALLEKLRKKARLTQAELAQETGITQGAISNYERGREPDVDALRKLGKFFNLFFVADWKGDFSEELDPLD